MKHLSTTLATAVLSLSALVAQNTPVLNSSVRMAMPVYNDEIIDEAPAGRLFSGVQRTCFSYFYANGELQGGYNDGFVGEFIEGEDGCIYIKQPCASIDYNSYLKLEKIDDENYVAHTAQLAWLYESSTALYTYFATRLVFKNLGNNQMTYQLETDAEGKTISDIYFTYKDGILQQKDQTTDELNGVIYPHELIGMTNATGGWIGYGDGCLTLRSSGFEPVVLPAEAEVREGSFSYYTMSSSKGVNMQNAMLTKFAEVGDKFYFLNPIDGKNWICGDIDRQAGTVSFRAQYVGINETIGCHQWFLPATYNDWRDVYDEEDNIGTWVRDYTLSDAYVCRYYNGSIFSDLDSKQTLVISRSDVAISASGAYSLFSIQPYEHKLVKPATPTILSFSPVEDTFFWGEIYFSIPAADVNGVYIDPSELYYNIYFNDTKAPFTFKKSEYEKIPEATMTDIPYLYDDDYEFDYSGSWHGIYFYEWGVEGVGVQSILRIDGQEMRSDIAWYGKGGAGISTLHADRPATTTKRFEQGRVIFQTNGATYNAIGQVVK